VLNLRLKKAVTGGSNKKKEDLYRTGNPYFIKVTDHKQERRKILFFYFKD